MARHFADSGFPARAQQQRKVRKNAAPNNQGPISPYPAMQQTPIDQASTMTFVPALVFYSFGSGFSPSHWPGQNSLSEVSTATSTGASTPLIPSTGLFTPVLAGYGHSSANHSWDLNSVEQVPQQAFDSRVACQLVGHSKANKLGRPSRKKPKADTLNVDDEKQAPRKVSLVDLLDLPDTTTCSPTHSPPDAIAKPERTPPVLGTRAGCTQAPNSLIHGLRDETDSAINTPAMMTGSPFSALIAGLREAAQHD